MSNRVSVTIRPLNEREIPLMIRVWKDSGLAYKPKGRDSLARLRRQWRADPELFLGAFVKGEIAGVVLLSHDNRKGWINRLAIVPDRQGKGIARLLITRAERVFRKRDIHIYCVHIEDDNPDSKSLFEKCGYEHEAAIHYYTRRARKEY